MNSLICYQQLPVWTQATIPSGFQKKHNTKAGTWAKLTILKGELHFAMMTESGEIQSEHVFSVEQQPPFIEPLAWHKIVSSSADIECQLSFYCQPEDYFAKKYKLSAPHSEIVAALPVLQSHQGTESIQALDLGCGKGRNALFLSQHGVQVDAWDNKPESIEKLNQIIQAEQIQNLHPQLYDLNQASPIEGQYNFIYCTVVMMFLQPSSIPKLIQNMQHATKSQGLNLIVCVMESDDCPAQADFSFSFKTAELKAYYQDWNILKYSEDIGQLHRTDEQGLRIQQRFAILLAQKK